MGCCTSNNSLNESKKEEPKLNLNIQQLINTENSRKLNIDHQGNINKKYTKQFIYDS